MSQVETAQSSFGHRWMSGAEVREAFVSFFNERGHRDVPSSSLVPHNDPTVLLTTAGMQQMTPYFLGLETPPALRMTSVQKCFRTVDIDEVGDESHCTFFFMLGNFSVGDYFKRESLAWSWEFLTEIMGLDEARLYPTVHPDDHDAYAIWRDEIQVPEARIGKLPDNWWGPVGPTGPNGPDSEIYFDLHPDSADAAGPGESSRYLEVWNNVFMEFMQQPDGSRTPLPRQNVDTGMGVERLTALMQGVRSIYDTDLYQSIIQRAAALANVHYGGREETDRALRVIADHSRAATFLISDGVLPGNEGRSYVLRRVLRRAIRYGRQLGLHDPFLSQMAAVVIDQFGDRYSNLLERKAQIERVIQHEEETFGRTLTAGMNRFHSEVSDLMGRIPDDQERVVIELPGEAAFRLYDTFGFPLDLTLDLAREQGIAVDQAGFDAAMARQRNISRGLDAFADASRDRASLYAAEGGSATAFTGYSEAETSGTIVAILTADGAVETADAGQPVEVILDRTPFYAESGGQVGDKGTIRAETGVIDIDDTFKPIPGLHVHRGTVSEGFIQAGEQVVAKIDGERRQHIMRNHTATHLLHRALRDIVGPDAHQAGSLVAPDRLRFDFTSLDALTQDHLNAVSAIVNQQIIASMPVTTRETSYEQAVASGAMALFGEKYGDSVRVVEIDGFSKELCGGTHLRHTGETGPFLIVSEGSVAAGVRRIEAVTGAAAVERMLRQQATLESMAREAKSPWTDLPDQLAGLRQKLRDADREVNRLRGLAAKGSVDSLVDGATDVEGIRVVAAKVTAESREALRQQGDSVRDRVGSGVVLLGTVVDDRPMLVAMVTRDLVNRGINAGEIVGKAAVYVGGRGGGRPDLAEAGGKDQEGLDHAIASVFDVIRSQMAGGA